MRVGVPNVPRVFELGMELDPGLSFAGDVGIIQCMLACFLGNRLMLLRGAQTLSAAKRFVVDRGRGIEEDFGPWVRTPSAVAPKKELSVTSPDS